MSKQNKGLFAFLAGVTTGAAAVFFSKKENREKTKEVVDQTVGQAKKIKQEVEEHPEQVEKKVKDEAKKIVKKVKEEITKSGKKAEKDKEETE
ncbi:MAG: hypothetical protein XD95_0084 [Microgenomates bacterium 39_7]|nr:MAG: hypothetical protein XD95_0084 [Microgenomates bacterium 39_7]